jgi:hypothetical protein
MESIISFEDNAALNTPQVSWWPYYLTLTLYGAGIFLILIIFIGLGFAEILK